MKTTWTWIVVGLVVLVLLATTLRERFGETAKIKNPVNWTATDIEKIRAMSPEAADLTDSDIRSIVGGFWEYTIPARLPGEQSKQAGWSVETTQPQVSDINKYLQLQRGATMREPIFRDLIKAYYIDQGNADNVFTQARGYTATETSSQTATTQTSTASSSGDLDRPTLANDKLAQDISVYAGVPRSDNVAANLYLNFVQKFYDTVFLPKKIRPPTDSDLRGFVDSIDVSTISERYRSNFKPALTSILDSYFSPANGPTGQSSTESTAAPAESATSPSEASSGATGPPGSVGGGATSGTTTGGSSGMTYGPNSGGSGGRNVWGPLFSGLGDTAGPVNGDSTKTNAYPVLLGGMQARDSTRIAGVGVVPPSGGSGGGFGFPSSASLGTDANSMYLPYSRQPGDMDLVPDPYRLAKNFSTSSYTASKTDPVPFLTDFSAFYK